MSNALKTVNVDFSQIESDLASGNRVTTKDLAKVYMVSPVTMRNLLASHFGTRITFKRGRTGGIALDGAAVTATDAEVAEGWTEADTSAD